ncbi:MAG: PepSY domain-containing protein [Parvibaculaceae bacterium]|nr:PepSY domain-containing protein [Parvibaculaceae bacterium]
MTKKKKKTKLNRFLLRWHRRFGLGAAVLVLILSTTGIALNHPDALSLHERNVATPWVLSWYGLENAPTNRVGYLVNDQWVSDGAARIFLNDQPVGDALKPLVGAVFHDGLIVVAEPARLSLFTPDGEFIETLNGLPHGASIQRIGVSLGPVAGVALDMGSTQFIGDALLSQWLPTADPIVWAEAQPLPKAYRDALNQFQRGDGIPLYRVILDVHSGRFFTALGPWIMDLAALILIGLSVSGFWVWYSRRK